MTERNVRQADEELSVRLTRMNLEAPDVYKGNYFRR